MLFTGYKYYETETSPAIVLVVVDYNHGVLGLCHCHLKVSKTFEGNECSEENNPGVLSV